MSTIKELNDEIQVLWKKNDHLEEQLTKLRLKQSTEQLDADQKRELVDQINIFDKRISENNQIILQNKQQITVDKQISLELIKNQGKSAASTDSL